MLRSSLRSRPAQSVGSPWLDTPSLFPKVIEIERYRHKTRKPVRIIPRLADDVREKSGPRRPRLRPAEASLKNELDAQVDLSVAKPEKGKKSGLRFQMRVLNQYLRCVKGEKGLSQYLVREATRESGGSDARFRVSWLRELDHLIYQARRFVQGAKPTGRRTSQHHLILRAVVNGKSFFITKHEYQNRVLAIKTGDQFNRKLVFHAKRHDSHLKVLTYRKERKNLSPR